jgi:hypothetical protein
VRYGRDLGWWEPYGGVTWVFSGGRAGDDPFVTRYQEHQQTLVAFSAGATLLRPGRPTLEFGVLRNQYVEELGYEPDGTAITRSRTLFDLFVGLRVGLFR